MKSFDMKESFSGKRRGFCKALNDDLYKKDAKDMRDLFSYNYIKFLEKNDLSSSDMVKKFDSHMPTVLRWRNGGMPNSEMMRLICAFFGCDYIDFFRRD